jgi:hypothetical protein
MAVSPPEETGSTLGANSPRIKSLRVDSGLLEQEFRVLFFERAQLRFRLVQAEVVTVPQALEQGIPVLQPMAQVLFCQLHPSRPDANDHLVGGKVNRLHMHLPITFTVCRIPGKFLWQINPQAMAAGTAHLTQLPGALALTFAMTQTSYQRLRP